MKVEYARQMVEDGRVYINTLENFRKEPMYDQYEISDPEEGTHSVFMGGRTIDPKKPESIPFMFQRSQKIVFKDPQIIRDRVSVRQEDCYIYCFSLNPNLKRFKDIGYDALVEISTPNNFVEIVTTAFNKAKMNLVPDCICNYVEYAERLQDFTTQTSTHPLFIKDKKRHSWQEEFRLVWPSTEINLKAYPLSCSEIKSLVRLI